MTKPLLEKSKQSMITAQLLLRANHYPSTINRAYYSCLQYILHILFDKLGHTREDLRATGRIGTHSQAQYLLELSLAKRDVTDYKWFQEKMPSFKVIRVDADYFDDPMDYGKGQDAINTADSIINTLKKYF